MVICSDDLNLAAVRTLVRIKPRSSDQLTSTLDIEHAETSKPTILLRQCEEDCLAFDCDAVCGEGASQAQIFATVEPMLKNWLEGRNCCVFAMGATGTGKTYTMQGTETEPGVIPRAAQLLFQALQQSRSTCNVTFSMLEIYNEKISDLLITNDNNCSNLPLREDSAGAITVQGLSEVEIALHEQTQPAPPYGGDVDRTCNSNSNSNGGYEKFLSLYNSAASRRQQSGTNMNKHSSRSHCVCTLKVSE